MTRRSAANDVQNQLGLLPRVQEAQRATEEAEANSLRLAGNVPSA